MTRLRGVRGLRKRYQVVGDGELPAQPLIHSFEGLFQLGLEVLEQLGRAAGFLMQEGHGDRIRRGMRRVIAMQPLR